MKLKQPAEQVSVPATTEEVRQHRLTNPKPNVPATNSSAPPDEGPIYKVYLAPMRYDANLKTQPPPDPNLIVLMRRVRVRPTLIFEGRVEGEALVAENHAAPPTPASTANAASAPAQPPASNPTVANKVRTFLKRIWDRNS